MWGWGGNSLLRDGDGQSGAQVAIGTKPMRCLTFIMIGLLGRLERQRRPETIVEGGGKSSHCRRIDGIRQKGH